MPTPEEKAMMIYREIQDPSKKESFRILAKDAGIDIPTIRTGPSLKETASMKVSEYLRPTLQGVGGTIGAMVGSGASPIAGTAAGGGLGFAIGDELADIFDETLGLEKPKPLVLNLTEALKNVAEGATAELGGEVVGRGIGAAVKRISPYLIPLTKESAEIKAGKILAAETQGGPIIAENIEEAKLLEELIPGLKFSRAEMTGDPDVIKFERSRERSQSGFAYDKAVQRAKNTKALMSFIEEVKGKEGVEDVISPLEKQRKVIEETVGDWQDRFERGISKFESGVTPQEAGSKIRESAIELEKRAKEKAKKRFQAVPEIDVDTEYLISEVERIKKPMSKLEDIQKNVPESFDRLENILKESDTVNVNDLQNYRSELLTELRNLQGAGEPNNRKISRINQLIESIDFTIDQASEASEPLKSARKFYKQEVIDKFKSGTIGEITKRKFGQYKVNDAQIAGRFFKPGQQGIELAKEFNKVISENRDAFNALKDYIGQDLVEKAYNPATGSFSPKKFKAWLSKNRPALREYGILDDFNKISKINDILDSSLEIKSEFDKSVASKFLDTDVEKAIQNAFEGKNQRKAAKDLLKKLEGNTSAISGLQNSFIDYIVDSAKTTGIDIKGNPILSNASISRIMKKYKPSLDIIFENSPKKIEALEAFQKSVSNLQRSKISPFGGGSDTAENIFTALSKDIGLGSSRLSTIVNVLVRPFKRLSDKEVNNFINRALLDPEYASNIIFAAKGITNKKGYERKISQQLANLGLVIKKDIERKNETE